MNEVSPDTDGSSLPDSTNKRWYQRGVVGYCLGLGRDEVVVEGGKRMIPWLIASSLAGATALFQSSNDEGSVAPKPAPESKAPAVRTALAEKEEVVPKETPMVEEYNPVTIDIEAFRKGLNDADIPFEQASEDQWEDDAPATIPFPGASDTEATDWEIEIQPGEKRDAA